MSGGAKLTWFVVLAALISACGLNTFGLDRSTTTVGATTIGEPTTTIDPTNSGGPMTTGGPTTTGDPTTSVDPTSSGTITSGGGSGEPSTTTGSEGEACDPWAQDCSPGLKCVPYASDGGDVWDANKCVPVGSGGIGATCKATGSPTSGYDSCGPGLICWDVDAGTLQGVCYAQCSGKPDAPVCPPDSNCSMTNSGAVNVCLADCDPLTNLCPEGQVCVPDGDDQFLCLAAGGVVDVGTACEYVNECVAGSMCASSTTATTACDPQSSFCCLPFCSVKDPMCPPDLTCVAYFPAGMAPPEHADLGLCQDP